MFEQNDIRVVKQQIEEKQTELARLEEHLTKLQAKIWPQRGDVIFFTSSGGLIARDTYHDDVDLHVYKRQHNELFRTEIGASHYLAYRHEYEKLRNQPGRVEYASTLATHGLMPCVSSKGVVTAVTVTSATDVHPLAALAWFASFDEANAAVTAIGHDKLMFVAQYMIGR